MSNTDFYCLPTIIGSMPHTNPRKACALIARFLKDIPAWPQLPARSFPENMYAQYSEGFPGIVVKNNSIHVDTSHDFSGALEALYLAYLNNDFSKFAIGRDYAAGLYEFLEQPALSPRAVKGHVTGPLSWGLTIPDEDKKAILFHEALGDAVPKLLKLKSAWQENELKKIYADTITFVDEPIMASYGSIVASGPFSKPEKIAELINEVFDGIRGLKGIHCCGNTDWPVILRTKLDILSFDAFNYAQSLSLYPEEVKKFLRRGGVIAWGIVPNTSEHVVKESSTSLKDRLEEAMASFTHHGIPFKDIVKQSLLTPSCSLASLTEDGAEQALDLLTGLSAKMRKRYR